VDEELLLAQLEASNDVAAEFRALEPQFVHYRLLQDWLVRYRALAQQQPALAFFERQLVASEDAETQPYVARQDDAPLLSHENDLAAVAGWAALDDVRDVGFPAREAGCLQGLIENHARRPNEGTTRGVFLATRRLADQDDGGIDGPFPGDRMDASRMEAAPSAGPNGRGNLVESLSPFFHPDQGARWRDPVLRRLHDLRSETRFVKVRIFG